ncbi:hypothetical protein RFI_35257 [Reticulomyxa filosa]|uniref:Uncharacterized protein n=1 Tax=Reticulomyxa filosa TaxID=46433 RepID=X6LLZ6_RETFI|nr:hypothetical protein RFI_35257 [Reticulomyxa filosa]|eukprot:ETO02177.1 hypothetical protein RFI_35257 [Reticulomyxa filosa]
MQALVISIQADQKTVQKTVDVSKFASLPKQQLELVCIFDMHESKYTDTKIETISIAIQSNEIECKSGGITISLNSDENQKNNDNLKEIITQINLILSIYNATAENNNIANNGINIKTNTSNQCTLQLVIPLKEYLNICHKLYNQEETKEKMSNFNICLPILIAVENYYNSNNTKVLQ